MTQEIFGEKLNRQSVPEVIYDRNPGYVELYWKAWELAAEHIYTHPGMPQERYMSEGCRAGRIWIWDTCFMVQFCKYARDSFPGIVSLENFYAPLHDRQPTTMPIHHIDNPPLFAWLEYEYARFTGDTSRLHRILVDRQYLQKHYYFLENVKVGYQDPAGCLQNTLQKNTPFGYLWSPNASGMDNTPRGDRYIYWMDILAQQALSAIYISRLAGWLGEEEIRQEFSAEYQVKKAHLNHYYFDEDHGYYTDISATVHTPTGVLTPASFWPLMAEAAPAERAQRQIQTLLDPQKLGGKYPLPSVSRDDPGFDPAGRYWCGGIWLPVVYMTVKSLEKYSQPELAAEIAERIIDLQYETYRQVEPHTIWECYSPSAPLPSTIKRPGAICRKDFCGWSALGPVSLMIENVIGLYDADGMNRKLYLRRRKQGRHGVKNFRFGDVTADIVITDSQIEVRSDREFTLVGNGTEHRCSAGTTLI